MGASPVAVVGVYETQQARRLPGRHTIELAIEAVRGALDDAGLQRSAIDGIAGEWPGPGGSTAFASSADWGKQLGLSLRWVDDTWPAGPVALERARAAILSGSCSTVLVVGGQACVTPVPGEAVYRYTRVSNEFIEPWGSTTPTEFALLAQRHMHLFGTTSEQIAAVSATIRNFGHRNPKAVMFGAGPYTVDDVLESRMVCSPLHVLDLSLVSEGAAAMIVTDRLDEASSKPVYVRAAASEFRGSAHVDAPVYEELSSIGISAADRVFGAAGLDRRDVDVFELYDPSSFEVIRQFEVLGYCKEGEGGPFASDGRLELQGSHPTNTDGGLLSHGFIKLQQMTQKVIEGVQQLRGVCGARQVEGARTALVTAGSGGAARYFSAALLSSEPN